MIESFWIEVSQKRRNFAIDSVVKWTELVLGIAIDSGHLKCLQLLTLLTVRSRPSNENWALFLE